MQDHQKLRVWKQAHELALAARRATRQFPRTGYGSLQTQITRAAESVVLTIVEGCGAVSQREFARYLDIAVKSSREIEAQLQLARDYGVMTPETWKELSQETVSIRRQLCTLRARVIASPPTARNAVEPETPNPKPETPNLDSGSPSEGRPP